LYDEAKEITMNFKPKLMANKDIAGAADVIYEKIAEYLDKNKSVQKPKRVEIFDEDAVDVLTIPKKKKADHELTILEFIQKNYYNFSYSQCNFSFYSNLIFLSDCYPSFFHRFYFYPYKDSS
jgi:hypothetical protein